MTVMRHSMPSSTLPLLSLSMAPAVMTAWARAVAASSRTVPSLSGNAWLSSIWKKYRGIGCSGLDEREHCVSLSHRRSEPPPVMLCQHRGSDLIPLRPNELHRVRADRGD